MTCVLLAFKPKERENVELVSIKNVALRVLALMKTQVTVMCIVGLEMVIAKME